MKGITSCRWLPRPRWLPGLLGFYKNPNIMALRMPDRKLVLWEHLNCLVSCCKLTPMGCLTLVILLRYVLCILILLCFLVIPKVRTILHFLICLPQSFPRVRQLNSSLDASRHSRLSDHMMHFRHYVRWLPRPRWLPGLLGFYKSPDIMALRMPDQKLLL